MRPQAGNPDEKDAHLFHAARLKSDTPRAAGGTHVHRTQSFDSMRHAGEFDEAETRARLRLYRSRRVGASTFHRLIAEHGTAIAALDALPDVAAQAGMKNYLPCPEQLIDTELKAAKTIGARLLCHGTPDYPALLALTQDAPPVLWAKGDYSLFERASLSIVGARNASSLALRFTRSLARDLGEEGYAITSGLARGIDAAAHSAALPTGTIAVLAGGLDVLYPRENAQLYDQISVEGLLLSEHPFGMKPFARHFPMRNRIVSGLSRATVVVEAAAKSGSLITAGMALDQGRDVMAVPGHPFDARSAGTNILIRDGATLVRGARDVIDGLAGASHMARTALEEPKEAIAPPRLPTPRQNAAQSTDQTNTPQRAHKEDSENVPTDDRKDITQLHAEILSRLSGAAIEEDALIRTLDGDPEIIATEILALELEGQLARKSGGFLARA